MGANFSTKKKSKGPSISEHDKTVLSLKAQRKKLNDQQKLLEQRINRHVELAKQLVKEKSQSKALLVLKKKKLDEKQLEQLGSLQLQIESLIHNVELTQQSNKVVQVLKEGNDVMKQLQKEVTVDDVQKLLDETAEAKAYRDEINAMLEHNLDSGDQEAVDMELEALEAEALAAELEAMPTAPAVPQDAISQANANPQQAETEPQAAEEEAQTEAPERVALLA